MIRFVTFYDLSVCYKKNDYFARLKKLRDAFFLLMRFLHAFERNHIINNLYLPYEATSALKRKSSILRFKADVFTVHLTDACPKTKTKTKTN